MALNNKVVVVTGASVGLGKCIAEQLVARGAIVYGLARNGERLSALESALGSNFRAVVCDVTSEEQVNAAFDKIRNEGKRIDVLVNNAGLGQFAPIDELPLSAWDIQMQTNLSGVFLCTRAAVPTMKAQNRETGFGGHIINIASVAGLIGNPQISAYNVTKFGLRGMSEALMKELREDGIKVSCVYPGSIQTEFARTAGVTGSPNPMQAEDVAATVLHLLDTPDNYLISEVVMRPLRPKGL